MKKLNIAFLINPKLVFSNLGLIFHFDFSFHFRDRNFLLIRVYRSYAKIRDVFRRSSIVFTVDLDLNETFNRWKCVYCFGKETSYLSLKPLGLKNCRRQIA